MRVLDVMTKHPRTVSPFDSATSAWEQMRQQQIRHLVVVEDHRVVGLLSAGDLGGRNGETLRAGRAVADLMTRDVVTATPETTVREAANLMRGRAIGSLPVLKGHTLAGIVTSRDLLELIGRGAERPAAVAVRAVLKHRGIRPHAQTAAKLTAGAKSPVRR